MNKNFNIFIFNSQTSSYLVKTFTEKQKKDYFTLKHNDHNSLPYSFLSRDKLKRNCINFFS